MTGEPGTGAEAFRAATARLAAAGLPDPARDARLLLAHALDLAPDRVMLALHDPLPAGAAVRLEQALAARLARQPVSQIIGGRQFWGRRFRVTPDVLDPRPETEVLVAAALAAPFSRVIDLGTGSGVILVTLLAERPEATGLGTDLSPAALAVAEGNAVTHGVAARARFCPADWWRGVEGRFDLIVSNPPYIAASEMAGLSPEVRDWEPHLALTPGGDGLDAYRVLAAGAGAHLSPGGRLFFEIGPSQGTAVVAALAAGGLAGAHILKDLDGRDRVVAVRAPA
ncbi:MAG: peptide chain release factor N(5)-glutamine methyltransferase [Gemmobacter sp.]|nr:peptide chain release factor N(5)-glutamine methyltransferase [Gemmobacter sp.]